MNRIINKETNLTILHYSAAIGSKRCVEIILDKWESYAGRPPLTNGTHMLYININQINTNSYHDDNHDLVKRLFILEE